MKKVTIHVFLLLIDLVISIAIYFLGSPSLKAICTFAIVSLIIVWYSVLHTDGAKITYSSSLLLYTCATQFGLIIPYAFIGAGVIANYKEWTTSFVHSNCISLAVLLGVIGVTSYELGVQFSRIKYAGIKNNTVGSSEYNDQLNWGIRFYYAGTLLLSFVLLFFLFHIQTGGMRLFSTYELFRQSKVYTSSIYSYILIIYYVGTIYLASAGKIVDHKIGWFIWLIIAVIFAANGNKGEFMYALLAVVGMKGTEGNKINRRTVLLVAGIIFILIPSITSLRSIGIAGNLSQFKFDPIEAFTEMGMQLRTSVFMLDDLNSGEVHLLYGRSYIQPIINILTPFMKHTQATAEIRKMYAGVGFNQVIESFLNFKMIGVMGFFGIVGYVIGKYEAKASSKEKLAYLGTVVCILINATRNYFAFVPGQILIVTLIFFVIKRLSFSRR